MGHDHESGVSLATPTIGWNGKPRRDAANRLKQAAIQPRSRRDGRDHAGTAGITENQPWITVIPHRIMVIPDRITVISYRITVIPYRITAIPYRITVIPERFTVIPDRLTVIPDRI